METAFGLCTGPAIINFEDSRSSADKMAIDQALSEVLMKHQFTYPPLLHWCVNLKLTSNKALSIIIIVENVQ